MNDPSVHRQSHHRGIDRSRAVAALVAIAMVHSDNGVAAAITMTLFAIGVAASVLFILSHDRPFTGEVAVGPTPLLEVMPDLSSKNIEVRPSKP